jgi:predicted secreted protein
LTPSLLFGLFFSFSAETVKVNKDLNGKEIKVRTGDTIEVELQEPGATGYSWEIQALDAEHFKVLSIRTEARKSGPMVGAPVMKIWSISALKEGKSKLKFLLYRPWEGEKSAENNFVINVVILGAN